MKDRVGGGEGINKGCGPVSDSAGAGLVGRSRSFPFREARWFCLNRLRLLFEVVFILRRSRLARRYPHHTAGCWV